VFCQDVPAELAAGMAASQRPGSARVRADVDDRREVDGVPRQRERCGDRLSLVEREPADVDEGHGVVRVDVRDHRPAVVVSPA